MDLKKILGKYTEADSGVAESATEWCENDAYEKTDGRLRQWQPHHLVARS